MTTVVKAACFIHSCTLDIWGTEILDNMIKEIQDSKLLKTLEYIFINNTGIKIDEHKYAAISNKIIIVNYSSDVKFFEICTLRQLYFFARFNPNYNILYMHTKGASHARDHCFIKGVQDWVKFMMYCLIQKHQDCIELLNIVDTIGCDYRDHEQDPNPSHYSGNFWWATSNYLATLSVMHLSDKYDAEWWLFKNDPIYINIHKCPYGHYENSYNITQYDAIVTQKLAHLKNAIPNAKTLPIFYGVDGNYVDITLKCHNMFKTDNVMRIPAGDNTRNNFFGDHIPGVIKHIRIGNVKYPFNERITLQMK